MTAKKLEKSQGETESKQKNKLELNSKNFIDKLELTIKEYLKKNLLNIFYYSERSTVHFEGHSRIYGLLVKTIHAMDYIVDLQRGLILEPPLKEEGKQNQNQAKPDIVIIADTNLVEGVIEYESIDANLDKLNLKLTYFDHILGYDEKIKFIALFYSCTDTGTKSVASLIDEKRGTEDSVLKELNKGLMDLSQRYGAEFLFGLFDNDVLKMILYKKGAETFLKSIPLKLETR